MLLQLSATSTARVRATPWLQVSPTWLGLVRRRREGERLVLCSLSSMQHLCAPERSQCRRGGTLRAYIRHYLWQPQPRASAPPPQRSTNRPGAQAGDRSWL